MQQQLVFSKQIKFSFGLLQISGLLCCICHESETCVVLFYRCGAIATKPEGKPHQTVMRTEMLLSCSQFPHALPHHHVLIWSPILPHPNQTKHLVILLLSLCQIVMTDLQAHAHCKHKRLAATPNLRVVLWHWMEMFNQYNPLNRAGRRLLQG